MSDETQVPGTAADFNISKEKTFNRELRDLVDRVTGNEGADRLPEESLYNLPDDIPDSINDRDLLSRLHQLFYHARHLPGLKRANTSFNPFTDWTGRGSDPHNRVDLETAGISLERAMTRMKMPSYAVLSYDLGQKCYVPTVCTMDGIDEGNLLMNVRDELVSLINLSEYGHILEPATIENDSFLKARFMPAMTRERARPLYCVSMEKLTSNLSEEIDGQSGISVKGVSRGCLLLVFLEGKWADADTETLCSAIQAAAAVPLMMICDRQVMDQQSHDFRDLDYIQGIVEYYSVICSQNSEISALILRRQGDYTPESAFYLYYLSTRLRAILSPDTVLIRLTQGIILIITADSQLGDIKSSVEGYNRVIGDFITMEIINDAECRDPRIILHRLLY